MNVVLTGGQIHDCQCATELLSKVKLEGKTVLGDKAFFSARIGDFIKEQGGIVSIPDKANSRTLYENSRRIATRYDKLAVCFLNFIFLVAFLVKL